MIPDLTLYEVARRNMVAFSQYFIVHNEMTKDKWFEIQRKVLEDFKKEIEEKK